MVRNKLAAAVLAVSAMQAGLASALGLGDMELKSVLNQPLSAEIALRDTAALDPGQIIVRLASSADFARAGLERDHLAGQLRFDVALHDDGSGVVKVSTREPVVEPYVSFLLEVRWPSGRLLREYTALVDLPRSAPPTAPSRSQAAVETPRPTRSAVAPAAGTALPEAVGEGRYRVQHSDTLSSIAGRFRPGEASVEQTMLAIQQLNPEAFIHHNINLVKSGHVLRLPTAEEAGSWDPRRAREEVSSQTEAWRAGRAAEHRLAEGPALDGRRAATGSGEAPDRGSRLSIVAAGDSDHHGVGEGTGSAASGEASALRDELAASQETLDKARRENSELSSRIGDLEEQIETLQKLLELKDDQLAALQARLDEVDTQSEPVDFNYAGLEEDEVPDDAAGTSAAAPADSAAGSSWLDRPSVWLGGGVALLAALLGLLLWRRRSDSTEDESAVLYAEPGEAVEADPVQETVEDEAAPVEEPAEAEIALDEEDSDSESEAAVDPVQPETEDPLAEAGIYMAYGRYPQAAALLQGAIADRPDDVDLRVKLLEVHVEARDREAFRREFAALESLGDADAIARVKEQLSAVDGVADWLDEEEPAAVPGPDEGAMEELEEALHHDPEELAEEPGVASSDEEALPDLDFDFEFEGLDDDLEDLDGILGGLDDGAEGEAPDLDSGLEQNDEEPGAGELSDLDLALHQPTGEAPVAPASWLESPGGEVEEVAGDELGLEGDLTFDDLDLGGLELESETEAADEAEELGSGLEEDALADLAWDLGDALSTEPGLDEEPGADLQSDSTLDLEESDFEADAVPPLEDLASELEEAGFGETSAESDAELPAQRPDESADREEGTDPFALAAATGEVTLDEFDLGFGDAEEATEDEDHFDFLGDTDEMATRLDLARAYIDMGDEEGARDILEEVLEEGDAEQRQQAEAMMERL